MLKNFSRILTLTIAAGIGVTGSLAPANAYYFEPTFWWEYTGYDTIPLPTGGEIRLYQFRCVATNRDGTLDGQDAEICRRMYGENYAPQNTLRWDDYVRDSGGRTP